MSTEKAHAKFGASKSERWLNCPGSVNLEAKAPPSVSSKYADEGTRAHECLEAFLKNPNKILETKKKLLKSYPPEMVDHADWAAQKIFDLWQDPKNTKLLSETKVELDFIEPGEFGTVDAAIVEEFGDLIVVDFKYGAGVAVDPTENTQGIYYALGLCHKYHYNFDRVRIIIIQPRADHSAGPVREWVTTPDNLVLWAKRFKDGIALAKKPNAPLRADSKWCQWCRAKVICPEISKKALAQAQIVFADTAPSAVELPPVKSLAIPRLGEILDAAEKIEIWISELRNHAELVLTRGQKVKGWKLVEKRTTRKYLDAEKASKEASRVFGKVAFSEPELLTPAQLEKRVKGPKLDVYLKKHVTNISSGFTVVPESDPRPAVNAIEQAFGGENDLRRPRQTNGARETNSIPGRTNRPRRAH